MKQKDETYLGDGLYASHDGFALWLRAPREQGDHECALEPQVLSNFLSFALSFPRHAKIIRNAVRERPELEEIEAGGCAPPILAPRPVTLPKLGAEQHGK